MSTTAVQDRLRERIEELGWSARALAGKTGDSEKNVQRWVYGRVKTVPAEFIARCDDAGVASATWLLTGNGPVMPWDGADARVAEEAAAFREIADVVRKASPPVSADGVPEHLFAQLMLYLTNQPRDVDPGKRLAAAFNEIQAAMDRGEKHLEPLREVWGRYVAELKEVGLFDPTVPHQLKTGADPIPNPEPPKQAKGDGSSKMA